MHWVWGPESRSIIWCLASSILDLVFSFELRVQSLTLVSAVLHLVSWGGVWLVVQGIESSFSTWGLVLVPGSSLQCLASGVWPLALGFMVWLHLVLEQKTSV